jgi:glycosyltransferase involved in cell wall biosynthesis
MMRSSDVFVLPSKFETQGVVLLESMASGLPIVSTTAGAIPEVVGPRDGILVEPGDPAALADALDRVLRGEVSFDREDMAERARSRYSLEAVGGQLMAIYADVLAARGKPAMKPESQMP